MGCSASRSGEHDFIQPQKPPISGSHSDPLSAPVSRSLSLPTRLVHHPAVRKGDSNHLVVLTSSTYGSLLLIDRPEIPNPNPNLSSTQIEPDPVSPDSVVNTWELMEGLDEDEFDFHVVDAPKVPSSESEKVAVELNEMVKSYEFVEHTDSLLPDDRIVVYYTSLRGIRKTFEDCCDVRMILRGFRVSVDEKDVSMDSSYRKELQGVMGGEGKDLSLPQVFIRGRHIGGANEIKQLNEAGELGELMKGLPLKQEGVLFCGSCGDARFVPCPSCNGSRKVFKNEESRLRRCQNCNENGLVRCPVCLP
ncbi:unnamed protein product [Cuscuta epithymum]|uniref:Glutaredoxin domain-containing protein n=1 Tax=Cuscuta epithymum TaxID=186058 RepID=A0AAV0EWE8_9ASTE|nr:unnamed protein product [Cuscuta epithymum]